MITSSTGYGKSCRCEMPTLSLPAVSLRLQLRLLALRILIIATNYLIYTVLSAIRRAISETDSNFLPALREADARATGSVDREMSCYQTVLEDAAAAVGEVALPGKALKRTIECLRPDPLCGRYVLRQVVAEAAAGHEDRLEPAAASDCGERFGHRSDIGIDREIRPVADEAAAGCQRVEASDPEHLVALRRAGRTVEVDEDRIEFRRGPGEKPLSGIVHDGLVQVEPAAGERDDRLVRVDQGRRAVGQVGADEAPHRSTADTKQQCGNRPFDHGEGERHQPLIVEYQARRVEQVHARLLGHLRPGAERAQGPEMAQPTVEIDDKDRSAEGLRTTQQADPRVAAEIIEDQALLPFLAIFGDHQAATRHDWTGTGVVGRAAIATAKRVNARPPPSLSV